MRAIVQRVEYCKLYIDDQLHSSIDKGLLLLLGIEAADQAEDTEWLRKKLLNLRVFEDNNDKMNLSILDLKAELMVVSQFTLFASTKKGNRPSYTRAASPEIAIPIYREFVESCKEFVKCESGIFGADMKLDFVNYGPVTIALDSKNKEY